MSIYVYCPRPSQSALELCTALPAGRLRRFDGDNFWHKRSKVKLKDNDTIVCWGASVPDMDNLRVLNSMPAPLNKYSELFEMSKNGVPVPPLYSLDHVRNYGRPLDTMLPRSMHHQGGRDLLYPPVNPAFYVGKVNLIAEYRIHSFGGRSIRAGVKVHRDGFRPCLVADKWKPNSNLVHPWIRSFDAGWRINYDNFASTQKMRRLASMAIKSLGLTFGAVDIGELSGGILCVLEVNRAPGAEGGTVAAYIKAITKWVENDDRGNGLGDEDPE